MIDVASPLQASDVYAISNSAKNKGEDECHWCGSKCQTKVPHDEPPPIIGYRPKFLPRRPGNGYVCVGCQLWRQGSITVRFFDEANPRFKDRQKPCLHSWWITKDGAWGLRENAPNIYRSLLKPPCTFVLALLDGTGVPNHLHCAIANDIAEIKADTQLHFTVNNIPHAYTVYELEAGLRGGKEGTLPGVQALIRYFGAWDLPKPSHEEARQAGIVDRGKGRPGPPNDGKVLSKQVTMSGRN